MDLCQCFRLVLLLVAAAQSLADVAGTEAERRALVDAQGSVVKVIDGEPGGWAPDANLTGGVPPPPSPAPDRAPMRREESQSLRHYRNMLQKLDQAIRKEERQLALKREKLEAGRRTLPGPGPLKARSGGWKREARERLEAEIREIGERLVELRRARADCYDEGRKAGFLPGELDGRGIR